MLYILDANVLITAHKNYYPMDRVPEFWGWLQHQGEQGLVKICEEMIEEVLAGHDDGLTTWAKSDGFRNALTLEEEVDEALVQRVTEEGYSNNLTDIEIEKIGRDPFLIAYGLADIGSRCIVTTEVPRPAATRQNRRVPDVCDTMKVRWCGPFKLNADLGFKTDWKPSVPERTWREK